MAGHGCDGGKRSFAREIDRAVTAPSPNGDGQLTQTRRWPWRVCVVLAVLLLFIGNLELWAYRTISDTSRFVAVAEDALAREDVRDALATRIVESLLADSPRLLDRVRDTLIPIVSGLLGTDRFQAVLVDIAAQLHRALTRGEQVLVTIRSQALQDAISTAVRVLAPNQESALTQADGTLAINLFATRDLPSYQREIAILRWTGLAAGIIGLALLLLPVLVRRDRAALRLAGLVPVGIALLTVIFMVVAERVIDLQIRDGPTNTVVAGIADELFELLTLQTLAALVIGIALVASSAIGRPRQTA